MATDADVIISGAGPAGSLAAYELAKRGVPVLVLEKSLFPRYKVCGAGLTHKILSHIPYDISPILETQVHTVIFSNGFRETFARTSPEPMMYCTNRDKLDSFLLQKAMEAGAMVIHGEHVKDMKQEKDRVCITTRSGQYSSRLVIGADGASGVTARAAALRENILPGLAWEAEVRVDPGSLSTFSKTMFLDWGTFPGGYGWVFPKGDHLSIGVGGPANLSKWMMPYYQKLTAYIARASGIEVLDTISLKSWPIPVRVKRSLFHNGRIVVAGDAAGLTDPLTGEGIYYAVRSGILAAESCHEALRGGTSLLQGYTRAVNGELMTELIEANRIKHLFNTVPLGIHHFVRDNDRAWRAFNKILRGERWYADVRKGFGNWKILWNAACMGSKLISHLREERFARHGFKLNANG